MEAQISDRRAEEFQSGPWQAPSSPEGDGIDLRAVLAMLWRGKHLIIASLVIVISVALLALQQVTPLFTATASIAIESRKMQVVDVEEVLSGVALDAAIIQTEVEVLKSRGLASRVVDRLGLVDFPGYSGAADETTDGEILASLKNFVPAAFSGESDESGGFETASGEEAEEALKQRAVATFLRRLTVAPAGRSLVIRVGYTADDPRMAALVVNTVAEQYISDQVEDKAGATVEANEWLSDRLVELKEKVRAAENAVESYRAKSRLLEGSKTRISSQQLSELNTQLVMERSRRSEAEARLRVVKGLLADDGGSQSASDILESPAVLSLKKEESAVLLRASELGARYGDRHPRIVKVRAEILDIRRRIEAEVQKIVQGLASEVEIAKSREANLRASLAALESKVVTQNQADVTLRELEREAAANRQLYEAFLNRFKETSGQAELQRPDARIISPASVPEHPSFPKKKMSLGVAGLGGLFFGLLLVFVRERLDNRFRSADQIEEITGVQALGLIPLEKTINKQRTAKNVISLSNSLFTESIRSLHAALSPSTSNHNAKVINITSSLPSEGKTVTSLHLARVAAQSGQKVLLIDCDMRRPSLKRAAGFEAVGNIVDLLADRMTIDEAITIDEISGAHFIASRVHEGNPLDLLRSKNMESLVEWGRQEYDLVLLDTPSTLAVADSKVLGQMADRTLYIVKWDGVPRDAVLVGIKQLLDVGIEFAGVTVSQVNLRRHSRYGYIDSGYYYGHYRETYAA